MNTKGKIIMLWPAGLVILLATIAATQSFLAGTSAALVLSLVFQWLALGALAVLAAGGAYEWLRDLGYTRRELVRILLLTLAAGCAGGAYILFFLRQEQDIKVYDSTVYWIRVIEDRAIIAESTPEYLLHLRGTFSREYNHLAAFPLIPASYVLGTGFPGFCLSIFLIYYLPACFFMAVLALRLFAAARGTKPGVASFAVCFGLCVLSPALLWPVMNGYLDVVGVLVAVILLNYSMHWDGVEFSIRRNLLLAALSLLLLLARRWYAFYIVGFYFSVGLAAVIGMAADKRLSPGNFGRLLANLGMIAGVSCLLILVINPAIFTLFLGGNYSVAYSAYKSMDLWMNLWVVARNAGLLWVFAGSAGVVLVLFFLGGASRLPCLRLLLAAGVAAVLFCSVQDMGYHHHYLILPTVLVFAGAFVDAVARFAIRRNAPVLIVLLLAACLLNFSCAYLPAAGGIANRLVPLTTALRNYPRKNPDYDTIRQVVDDLSQKIGEASEHVYVVGDAPLLSPETLKRSHLPEETDAAPYVLVNNIVDLRDGFPSQMFMAEYILTGETLQTEFQTPQQVSLQVQEMLLHDPEMARYYQLETTYPAAQTNILLYRKIRPADAALVDRLRDRLRERNPNAPLVYEPNYFIALFQPDRGVRYVYDKWDDNAFKFDKKARIPVIFRLQGVDRFSSLSFAMSCWSPGLELIVENQNGVLHRSPVLQAEKHAYTVDVAGSEFLIIGVVGTQRDISEAATFILYRPSLR